MSHPTGRPVTWPARRAVAAVAAATFAVIGLGACGDDDDPQPESPATGANLTDEGNVDVSATIADPAVVASNVADIDPPAGS